MKTNSLKILSLAALGFTLTQGEGQAQNPPPFPLKCQCMCITQYKPTTSAVVKAPKKTSSPSSSLDECVKECESQITPDVDSVTMNFYCSQAWVGPSPSKSK